MRDQSKPGACARLDRGAAPDSLLDNRARGPSNHPIPLARARLTNSEWRMSRRFRPGPHVLFQDLDAEAVLLNLSSGVYYGAGGVGARVWTLLLEGKTTEEI